MSRIHVSILSLGLCACLSLTTGANAQNPETLIKERTQQRWEARLDGRYQDDYAYISPGFRSAVSADAYRARFEGGVEWLEAEVKNVSCEATRCEVKVDVTFRLLQNDQAQDPAGQQVMDEIWIFVNDEWWLYQEL